MALYRPHGSPVEAVRFLGVDPFGFVEINEPEKPAWLTEALNKPAGASGGIDVIGEMLRVVNGDIADFAEPGHWLVRYRQRVVLVLFDEFFTARYAPVAEPSRDLLKTGDGG